MPAFTREDIDGLFLAGILGGLFCLPLAWLVMFGDEHAADGSRQNERNDDKRAIRAIEAVLAPRPQPELKALLEKARDRFRESAKLHGTPTLWQYRPELADEYGALADEIDRALSDGAKGN